MSQPDDIDRLLREVEALNNPAAVPAKETSPAPAEKKSVSKREGSGGPTRGGRIAWTGASAVGGLATGGVVGTVLMFLPFVSTASTAIGAALGGAVIGLVSGPPAWFDRE
jgi:hypothetical protein